MKKFVIPFIIVVFIVCAFFGFKAASKLLSSRQSPIQLASASTSKPITAQKNLVFIHVNDLTLEKPDLISVWVGFINESSPPQYMFLPIFPAYNTEIHDRIFESFSLSTDKKVSQRFINQLKSSYDFSIDGYILSDDAGISRSNLWLTGIDSQLPSIITTTPEEKHTLLLTEQTSWQQFCTLATSGSANAYFSAINWGLLLPDHFSTNLDFENLTLLTDHIVHATGQVQCEILSNE